MKKDPTNNKQQLGQLLERYKRLLKPPQASVEKEAISVIAAVSGITLTSTQVRYTPSTRTLAITAPSVIRSELLRITPTLLSQLQNELGAGHAPLHII